MGGGGWLNGRRRWVVVVGLGPVPSDDARREAYLSTPRGCVVEG